MLREDIGAKRRRQKYYEVGNLHTRFGSPCGPVADLIAWQSIRTMGDGKSGASIVQVSVPEFSSIDFREAEQ